MSPDLERALAATNIDAFSLSKQKSSFLVFLDKRGFFTPNNGDSLFAYQALKDLQATSDAQVKACQFVINAAPAYLFQDVDKALRLEALLAYIQRHADPERPNDVLSPAVTMLINNASVAGKQGIITNNHNLYFDILLSSAALPRRLNENDSRALNTLRHIYQQSPHATSWRQALREGHALTTDALEKLNQLTEAPHNSPAIHPNYNHIHDYYQDTVQSLRNAESDGLTDSSESERPKSPR